MKRSTWFLTAALTALTAVAYTACSNHDDPLSPGQSDVRDPLTQPFRFSEQLNRY